MLLLLGNLVKWNQCKFIQASLSRKKTTRLSLKYSQ
nr:MAG TPA: hypothetical protein [Inoviridae sp.]